MTSPRAAPMAWLDQGTRLRVGSLLCCALFACMQCALPNTAGAADADEDGLDDALEAALIRQYRPYYYYDSANDKWPSSVTWFVSRAELWYRRPFPLAPVKVYTAAQLRANPRLILEAPIGIGGPSDSGVAPAPSAYYLDPQSSVDSEGEGACVDVGCYAHVVPVVIPDVYLGRGSYPSLLPAGARQDAILVQYYQFFPYNDSQSLVGGDHEGDWTYLDIYVSALSGNALIGYVYHHHGDDTCRPTLETYMGSPASNVGVNCGGAPEIAPGPQCFLEEDNHEWWPRAGDNDCTFWGTATNDRHDGQGVRYRVENVVNLGEQFAPTTDPDGQLAIGFNGQWGNDTDGSLNFGEAPKCITDGGEHFFPSLSHSHLPLVVVHMKQDASPWDGAGLGSRFHPVARLSDASGLLGSRGTIKISAGSYPAPAVLGQGGQKLRLEASGAVVIGRRPPAGASDK